MCRSAGTQHVCLGAPESGLVVENTKSTNINKSTDIKNKIKCKRRVAYEIRINCFSDEQSSTVCGFCNSLYLRSLWPCYSIRNFDKVRKLLELDRASPTY